MENLLGAVFVLVGLSVVNSIVLIAILVLVYDQIKQLADTCEHLKNFIVAQSRRSRDT